jgi:SAM-dependent methyltransferase
MTNSTEDPVWHIVTEASGYLYAAALRAVALLDVADHLVDGPRAAEELAALTGAHGPFLRRLLRYLATRAVFREDEHGRFHLTPAADVLRAGSPRSVRMGVLTATAEPWWLAAGDLVEAVRHGEPAFDRRYGQPFFDHLAANPDMRRQFAEGMAELSAGHVELVTAAYDFPTSGVVVDVGGGVGGLLLAVLRARPGLRGVLLDHRDVVAATVLGQLGEPDRWEAVAGDFFDSVPAGDLYLVKNVLHDWSDDRCVRILSNCRRAMRPDGRLLVVDAVIPPGNEPHFGKALDMVMMLLLTGQERTRQEFEALFSRSGFRLTRVLPTGGALTVLEAGPA